MNKLRQTILFFSCLLGGATALAASPTYSAYKDTYNEKPLYQENKGNVKGNVNGSLTIVDFADYQCAPCRKMEDVLNNLIKKDNHLRIIYIDYPMFGERSTFAAKAALAARSQNKYLELHEAMMHAKKPLTSKEVFSLAAAQGIDVEKLKTDMSSKRVLQHLLDNMMLGNSFAVVGIPTYIIGYTTSPHRTRVYVGIEATELTAVIKHYEHSTKAVK